MVRCQPLFDFGWLINLCVCSWFTTALQWW